MTNKEKRSLKRPPRVFSDQFVAYVDREMKQCQGAHEEEKFQIHREVFQYLIEQFSEHRQVLCDVKVQYDAAMTRRDDRIRELEDKERQLSLQRERHTHQLKSAQASAYERAEELQEELAKLRHRMAVLCDERRGLQTELEQVRESLLVERRRYREEHTMRQVADADLDDVKQRYDNLLRRVNSRPSPDKQQPSTTNAEDPLVLRVALNKCREELKDVSARLVIMETSYIDVVPKRELLLAQAETERVRSQGENKLADLELILQQEREADIYRTPRPDWSKAGSYIYGGAAAWLAIRGELASSAVMISLLDLLSSPGPDTFAGLGTESEIIPVFLKWQDEVRNIRMTRAQVTRIVCDIFECKENNEEPFQNFVFEYFKERYPRSWPDWTYSFHYALERLTADDAHHLLVGQLSPAELASPGGGFVPPPGSHPAMPGSCRDRADSVSTRDRAESVALAVDASGRTLSTPERLKLVMEERQRRMSVELAAAAVATPREEQTTAITAASSVVGSTNTNSANTGLEVTAVSPSVPEGEETGGAICPTQSTQGAAQEVQNRRIQLFWNVLYGMQHEAVYTRDRDAIKQLKKEFCVADADKMGKVLYDSLGRIISETYFGIKTDEEIQRLVLAAAFGNAEMDTVHAPAVQTVQYSTFLDTCRETDSAFLQEFYEQTERAGATYASHLMEIMSEEELIIPCTVQQAVASLTPDVLPASLDQMCRWIFVEEGQPVPIAALEERLKGLPLPPERVPVGETEAA